jgi:hypothetical protein
MAHQPSIGVIGAGFYGLYCATQLSNMGYEVTIFDRNVNVLSEASTLNQARVHNGYHYPRSLSTAARSAKNYPKFISDFSDAIVDNFQAFYLIARDSKVSTKKFLRFCELIQIPATPPSSEIKYLFSPELIESVWLVEECSFDAQKLSSLMLKRSASVNFKMGTRILSVSQNISSLGAKWELLTEKGGWEFDYIIDATYGGLTFSNSQNNFSKIFEVCELLSVESGGAINDHAFTVMDGPFWSLTPWPTFNTHALTHVRHTPHARFSDRLVAENYLEEASFHSRRSQIVRDVKRYFRKDPELKIIDSHFVVKTIPRGRDVDDARPIKYSQKNHFLSILGSKIDNVYELDSLLSTFIEGQQT